MKRQSGITLVGFVIMLIIAAFFAYTLMKLVPAYIDYFSVSKALNTVASQIKSQDVTLEQVHTKLDLQQLGQYFADSDININNIHVVKNSAGATLLQLKYDKEIHWIYNIDFLLHFEKSAQLRAPVQQ